MKLKLAFQKVKFVQLTMCEMYRDYNRQSLIKRQLLVAVWSGMISRNSLNIKSLRLYVKPLKLCFGVVHWSKPFNHQTSWNKLRIISKAIFKVIQKSLFYCLQFVPSVVWYVRLDLIRVKTRLPYDLMVTVFGTGCLIHRSTIRASQQICVNLTWKPSKGLLFIANTSIPA